MKNTLINRLATVKVAKALGELCDEVVFVGGAMVSLYIDDPHAEDIRPTKDIDLTFCLSSEGKQFYGQWHITKTIGVFQNEPTD